MALLSLFLGPVFGAVSKIVGGWLEHKQKMRESRQEAEQAWAATMAAASATSWKDEWWVILFSMPIILVMAGYPGPMQVLQDIFGAETLRYIYIIKIGASFGINLHDRFQISKVKSTILKNHNGNGVSDAPASPPERENIG